MTRTELLGRRWAAQGLNRTVPRSAVEAVARLGAVQAQDSKMALAAVAHCLMNAELDLVLCNGPWGPKPTYDLVDRRVPGLV